MKKVAFCFEGNVSGKGFDIQQTDGVLNIRIFYDFHENPLVLTANAAPGDQIELKLRPYRIELYVNGEIADEEWPCGNCLARFGEGFTVTEEPDTEVEEPTVISTFKNAEGWKPEDNIFVGDCMPYVDEGRYHVLYLKDRHHHDSKWHFGAHQWSHISTDDFVTWQIHPLAVGITDLKEGSICTGSWIKNDGMYYLFYTIRMADRSAAQIKRSISTDGYHFKKDETFGFSLGNKYDARSARDPKVICDSNGLFHMFLTTALVKENKGCLAHLISTDLDSWEEFSEPIYVSDDSRQPECPDYFKYKDRYYLLFSIKGTAQYRYSDKEFTDWQIPEAKEIPCSSVPKAAVWNGKIVFTGFNGNGTYGGTMTFKTAETDKNGEFVYNE